MELQGKVIAVLPVKSGMSKSGKAWESQEYVIESKGEYPKKCVFSVWGEEKINEFSIKIGDKINISAEVDAHEYGGKWYNSIRAYRISKVIEQKNEQPKETEIFPPKQEEKQEPIQGADDLPF
jgi:hypothetical protein